jgi:acyl carrier protein
MRSTDIERDIKAFLVERFFFGRLEVLREDGSLLGGVVDSTGLIEVVMFLQERFGIIVEDDEVTPENLDSVKNLVAYVSRKIHVQEQLQD